MGQQGRFEPDPDTDWETLDQPRARPGDNLDAVDGQGEDYGWPTLAEPLPDAAATGRNSDQR